MPSHSNNTQFDIFMFLFWSCDGTVYVCRRHLLIYRVQGSQTCGSWASCRSLASLHLLPSLLYLMFVNRTNWAHSIGPAVQWNCMAAIIWKVVFVLFGEFYLVVKGKNTSLQHLWFLFSAWGACFCKLKSLVFLWTAQICSADVSCLRLGQWFELMWEWNVRSSLFVCSRQSCHFHERALCRNNSRRVRRWHHGRCDSRLKCWLWDSSYLGFMEHGERIRTEERCADVSGQPEKVVFISRGLSHYSEECFSFGSKKRELVKRLIHCSSSSSFNVQYIKVFTSCILYSSNLKLYFYSLLHIWGSLRFICGFCIISNHSFYHWYLTYAALSLSEDWSMLSEITDVTLSGLYISSFSMAPSSSSSSSSPLRLWYFPLFSSSHLCFLCFLHSFLFLFLGLLSHVREGGGRRS